MVQELSQNSAKPLPDTKVYRLKAKGLFLTYPQCPAPREHLLAMLETKGTIAKGLIA